MANHHASGLMRACAEGQMRIYLDSDIEFFQVGSPSRQRAEVAAIVDDAALANDYRFEALLFPLLVPVAVFGFAHMIGDVCIGEGKR